MVSPSDPCRGNGPMRKRAEDKTDRGTDQNIFHTLTSSQNQFHINAQSLLE